jgi:AcrR family transcriptional regulator
MREKANLIVVDGRRQRSERSRSAIITATLSLIDNGNFAPTARQIAEEAGVGLRSFFRHFDDMDALMDMIDQQMRAFYEPLFNRPIESTSLAHRIEDVVADRSEAYERMKKMIMAGRAQLWRSKSVQKNYARNQVSLREHLEKWLPELKNLPAAHCEAAHALASFETWHRLRQHQNMNISDAREAIMVTLTQLID